MVKEKVSGGKVRIKNTQKHALAVPSLGMGFGPEEVKEVSAEQAETLLQNSNFIKEEAVA